MTLSFYIFTENFFFRGTFILLSNSAKDIAHNLISFWIRFWASRHFFHIVPSKKCHDCQEKITGSNRNIMLYEEGSRLI